MPTVIITVTRNGIVVDQDPVKVPRDQRDVPIDWSIKTAGWQFTKDGIEIKKNYLQFKGKRRHENSKQFRWVSRNSHKERAKSALPNCSPSRSRQISLCEVGILPIMTIASGPCERLA